MAAFRFTKGRIFGLFALGAIAWIGFGVLTSNPGYGLQNIKDGDTCISYRKVRFKLADSALTVFDIPNGYLFTRYGGIFISERDPATFFRLAIYRKNFRPSCSALTYDQRDRIEVSVHPSKGLEIARDVYQHDLKTHVPNGEKDFELYQASNGVRIGSREDGYDFLIPKDPTYKETLFIRCAKNYGKRLGCHVFSQLDETVRLEYVFDHTDLPNYREIDQNMNRIISGFITSKDD